MSITPGMRLGPYEIERAIGVGGMGEVFRARDLRLNRPVAVKFLSERIADRSARQRFQQEARTASALNHPHILTVHDTGELDDRQYIVMEYVDGGTLHDWAGAQRGSWRQIVEMTIGVADALAAAHAAGILHRDIKPANILVSSSGYAKLADFGLAKLDEGSPGAGTIIETRATLPGTVVGTIPYMSPEQTTGRPLDQRSDIFSFGIVLYELLSGQRPFRGASELEVLQAIAHRPHDRLSQTVPDALKNIVDKALEKDPAERYQSMRELVIDLRRTVRQQPETPPGASPARSRRPRLSPWLWAAAALVAIAVIGWYAGLLPPRREPDTREQPLSTARFTRLTDFPGSELQGTISPDGRWVAFVSNANRRFDIWVGQIGTGRFVNVTEKESHATDFRTLVQSVGFFPDGSTLWLGGGPDRRVLQLPLTGGALRPFLGERVISVAWSPDGTRVVYQTRDDGDPTFVADRNGSSARRLFVHRAGVHSHYPIWSTDGRWIFVVHGLWAAGEMDIWRVPSDGGELERMTRHNADVGFPTPIDTRTVLYVAPGQDGSGPWLWSLDTERRMSQRVSFGLERYTSISASADGRRLVATVANPVASLWRVPILDRVAEEQDVAPFALPTVRALAPRFSGATLFYLSSNGSGDGLWSYQNGQTLEIWKGADAPLREPAAVSPDGRQLAVVLRRDGKVRLAIVSADGAEVRSLVDEIDIQGAADWSPDARWIVAGGIDARGPGLFKIPVEGGAAVRIAEGLAFNPVWSPDGTFIVYAGANVNATSPLLAVTPEGAPVQLPDVRVPFDGERVRFHPDGRRLVYVEGLYRQNFWLLDLTTRRTRQLTRLGEGGALRSFDVMPDGRSIVFDRSRDNSDLVLIERP
jgi:serine/threonine protein kinase